MARAKRRIGPFALEGTLGQGGMGVVYRARDTRVGRSVALKLLANEERCPAHSRRFLREAEALARVRHPHVIGIHDIGQHHGAPYLVAELVEGESLARRLEREGALEVDEALRIALELCGALEAAHAVGVLHRDVKPGNVQLDAEGRVKLLDFGIALLTDRSRLTQSRAFAGTLGFCPPEQVRGQGIGPRADVFGAGATLYAMLTGEPPGGRAPLLAMGRITLGHLTAPTQLRPELAPELEQVLLRALSPSPEDRFASANELAAELSALRGRAIVSPWRRTLRRAGTLLAASLTFAVGGLALGASWSSPEPKLAAATPQPTSASTAAAIAAAPRPAERSLAEIEALAASEAPAPELAEAVDELLAQTQHRPRRHAEALRLAVLLAWNRFDLERGLDLAERLVALEEGRSQGLYLRTRLQIAAGQEHEAVRSLQELARLDDPYGWLARRTMRPTISVPPQRERGDAVFHALADFQTAVWEEDLDASLSVLERLASSPLADSAPRRLLLANFLVEGWPDDPLRLAEAWRHVEAALRLTAPRRCLSVSATAANVLLHQGKNRAALERLEGVPTRGDVHVLRGLALLRLGQRSPALDEWRRGIERYGRLAIDVAFEYATQEEVPLLEGVARELGWSFSRDFAEAESAAEREDEGLPTSTSAGSSSARQATAR